MSGAMAVLFGGSDAGGGGAGGLTAAIGAGSSGASHASSHAFALNTCVATGGTGPYTYAWSESDDAQGAWTSGAGATLAPAVSGLAPGSISYATYVCTVTDSLGHTARSNSAGYSWQCNSHGGPYQ